MSEPTLPDDWRGTRCGHNFEIPSCPHQGCVSRQLYEALQGLFTGGFIEAGTREHERHQWSQELARRLEPCREVLARARGDAVEKEPGK